MNLSRKQESKPTLDAEASQQGLGIVDVAPIVMKARRLAQVQHPKISGRDMHLWPAFDAAWTIVVPVLALEQCVEVHLPIVWVSRFS